MKRAKGFTLVEIMIVVAIIALLAAIAIPNLLRAKMSANDASAKAALRSLSTACETFAVANQGNYPDNITDDLITGVTPAYINKNYCSGSHAGYTFNCAGATASGYTILAEPTSAGTSGTTTFTISTGGVLTPE